MQLTENKILITGGGSGLGLGLAERFHAMGNTVIICGRRQPLLREAAERLPGLITWQCDLNIPGERINLYQWIAQDHADLQVLVNNAGIQQWMAVDDEDFYERAHAEININIDAQVHLCSLFLQLPSLHTLINVSSGLAFAPLVKVPVYCATKAFMHSFTVSMRRLLAARNIEVIEMMPPALNTDLGGKGIHSFAPPVSEFLDAAFAQLREGKPELVYGFSENMVRSNPEELRQAFERMNAPRS